MPRARPLSPELRREALIEATLPLLYQHGAAVTTRLIAEAAGVAEGTIFRVFSTKDELIDAVLVQAFDPTEFLRRLDEIEPTLPLEERLLRITSIAQQRFLAVFGLLRAMSMVGPPEHLQDHLGLREALEETQRRMLALVEPDADALAVPPDQLLHLLRLLTFAGSHHEIADGRLLSPDQIVRTVLHGVLRHEQES